MGKVEEVEGFFRFGVDVGEVLLDPRPGEASDFNVALLELGVWVWVWGRFLGRLDALGDDAGIVVTGYGFNIPLPELVCLVFAAVFEVRCRHHDLNGLTR